MFRKFSLCFFILFSINISCQELTPNPNYDLATRFSTNNVAKMVHSTSVYPNWLKNGNRFWYQYKTTDGSKYYLVDADKRERKELFDNDKMAAWLTEITKDPYDGKHLPKFDFKFVKNETAIQFYIVSNEMVNSDENDYDLSEFIEEIDEDVFENLIDNEYTTVNSILFEDLTVIRSKTGLDYSIINELIDMFYEKKNSKKTVSKKTNKVYLFEYELGSNRLKVVNNKRKEIKRWNRWANISPDSSIVVFSKNFNLFWMDKENFLKAVVNENDSTIVENQWTEDGEKYFDYGTGSRWDRGDEDMSKRKRVNVYWSHDSKSFTYTRVDNRMIKDLWVLNSISKRPKLETYKYHMAGEQEYPKSSILHFDVESKNINSIELDSTKQKDVYVFSHMLNPSKLDDEFRPNMILSKKGDIYFQVISRDKKKLDTYVAPKGNFKPTLLISETTNTYHDIYNRKQIFLIENESEILYWSERDGWGHLYRYDKSGKLINRLTKGPYHVESIVHFDPRNKNIFFKAHGYSKDIDPYYEHLYRVNINGSNLKILNPGNFNTSTYFGDKDYFVNNFSRVNTTPKSELRDDNGNLVLKLETADLSALFDSGYKFPEPFKAKANDGITDIYGVMYKPFDFDPTKKYPLIEYVYPGPQTEQVDKSFVADYRWTRKDRLAQIGFIVVTLGNRGGHPDRSKWYHNYGYGNLRDYGLADKKYVAEQLAARHDFIDINKVGIFGHSGGGFMSTAAMLVYPDFFKVAVSSAGNHDNAIYNSWWSESHHGIEKKLDQEGNVEYEYEIDNNQELAKNLKGHLLLVTGDMDNNVHPAATMRVVDALIKENKRFSFMILPGQRHGFGNMSEYFFWLKADYFSKHLLGKNDFSIDMNIINQDIPQN